MTLFEDHELALPMPGKAARRAALIASVSMLSGLALAVSYFVPSTSRYIENCRKAAAAQFPGEVRLVSVREKPGATLVRLYIEARDGAETAVVCDGPTGRIVRGIPIEAQ